MRIYADNAATTRISGRALKVMLRCMQDIYGNPSSIHPAGEAAAAELYSCRQRAAGLLGCDPQEITFTSGGTEADNQALLTGAYAAAAKGRMHIISTKIEHHAVLHMLEKLEREGFSVTLLPAGADGTVQPEAVKQAVTADTGLVSVMYVNNETGVIQPVREIASFCRTQGILFHTDAVQAAGHIPICFREEGIDLLSLSGHKFHGPAGTGMFLHRRGIPPAHLLEGGGQERGTRPGTENLPGIAGMCEALQQAVEEMERNGSYTAALRNRLERELLRIPGAEINGTAERIPGTLNMYFPGASSESMLILLGKEDICVSAGSACSAGAMEASHVLTGMGRTGQQAMESIRFSLAEDNTEEETDRIIEAVTAAVERLRK